MSVFLPNIPQPTDNLDFSQGQLLSNNQGLDAVFGIDHYKFSDPTANKGFHNTVTQPPYVATPPTGNPPITAANPSIYAFQDSTNIGVIQYSRGPSDAVPTPITHLNSTQAGIVLGSGATTNVLDFTGLTRCVAQLYGWTGGPSNALIIYTVFFDVGNFNLKLLQGDTGVIVAITAGNILQIQNVSGSNKTVYWSLQLIRTT